jgi:predicted lipoprotein with Yx(FWY)xxD motif
MKRTLKDAVLFAALLQAAALVQASPTVESNGRLASADGRTLYTFDKDSPGRSSCSGGCIAAWPAFTVADPTKAGGDFSIVMRDDGVPQWAYRGRPLYFFAGDSKAGDANGDKQGGVWHVVRTAPARPARTDAYDKPSPFGYSY